ncbi:MAG: DUF447 family protein, partial [Planctomycetales bacterium]|nr:DUF447 family protein [Planctomycetales bacterium]
PFQTSQTFQNLRAHGEGVLHVTDDVELLARAAIGQLAAPPALRVAERVQGSILNDACRAYEFVVESIDDSQPRSEISARVVAAHRQRDFFGFNRAMHACLEAAILATRIGILPEHEIRASFERLAVPVEKTAGDAERRAFALLSDYISEKLAGGSDESETRAAEP